MQLTIHKAFDIVVAIVKFDKNEPINLEPVQENVIKIDSTFRYIWYNISGSSTLVNTETGERLLRPTGACTLSDPDPQGNWRLELQENLEVLCISPFTNSNKLPLNEHLTKFELATSLQTKVSKGAKLFLAKGSLIVDGKLITGPKQISFTSDSKTVMAEADCYGVIVK